MRKKVRVYTVDRDAVTFSWTLLGAKYIPISLRKRPSESQRKEMVVILGLKVSKKYCSACLGSCAEPRGGLWVVALCVVRGGGSFVRECGAAEACRILRVEGNTSTSFISSYLV